MVWRKIARIVLHDMGGLAALRRINRGKFQALMFHAFEASDAEGVEAICRHIVAEFNPVSISDISAALQGDKSLPGGAVTVTVDDAYRNFWLHGWPIFRKYRIPVSVYVVTEFTEGRIWLWPDQIEYGLQQTFRPFVDVRFDGRPPIHLDLSSPPAQSHAIDHLIKALKAVPNHDRVKFLNGFEHLCDVDIPASPPPDRQAMSWDELRVAKSEGMEIGCHTATHPILSRIQEEVELQREIAGAKQCMEAKLGFSVVHFAYPNGQPADINDSVVTCVRQAGFATAVTTTRGLNSLDADSLRLRRTIFDSKVELHYGSELLAGLHN